MQHLILISGFGGSGKTTCAGLLWERLEHVALLSADHLFRIKPFDMSTEVGREHIGRIKLRNCLAALETFLDQGYAHVLCDGLVWSQRELDAIVEMTRKRDCHVSIFWLETSKNARHARAIARKRDEADQAEFLELVERTISNPTPLNIGSGSSFILQTDRQSPGQVVEEMLRHIAP